MSGCLSKYGHTRYISADTAAQQEEIERLGTNSLKEVEEKNEILRGFKSLSDERLNQVSNRCEELHSEYWRTWRSNMSNKEEKRHEQEYINKIRDYVQQELKVTFNMRDDEVRYREVGNFVFYIMWRGEKPDARVLIIFELIIFDWVREQNIFHVPIWYSVFDEEKIFSQFYKRLGGTPACLEYLIYKQPQLLFDKDVSKLIQVLFTHLQYDVLHQILMNTRNEQLQTPMFYVDFDPEFSNMYRNHVDDFYDLLSIRDFTGRTALHLNAFRNSLILCNIITLNNLTKLNKLLTITDNNNRTAQQTTSHEHHRKQLAWWKRQCDNGNYPLYKNHHVLILYNTNERPGAEDEACSIHEALFYARSGKTELKKMGKKHEMIQTIKEAAEDSQILIVCVMSHGSVGTIEDSERNLMTLTEIEGAMCSDQLKERPKILITQCCQSNEHRNECLNGGAASSNTETLTDKKVQTEFNGAVSSENFTTVSTTREGRNEHFDDGGNSSNQDPGPPAKEKSIGPYVPVANDFLAIQSSVCGQPSDRNVFIPYLAEQIENSSTNDSFIDLVENASQKMKDEGRKQIPIVKSTLRGKICLKDNRYPLFD